MNDSLAPSGSVLHRLWSGYMAHRFAVLFFTLLLSMAAFPIMQHLGYGARAGRLVFGFSLMAVLPTVDTGWRRATLLSLLSLTIGVNLVSGWLRAEGSVAASQGVWVVLGLLAAVNALRHAFNPETRSDEKLYAVLATYLLAATFFAMFHALVEQAVPGSYASAGVPMHGDFPMSDAVYFSFVTIATLGYGDIVPLSALGRGITILEAVGGQLYIAALVASLVGASMPRPPPRQD